MPGVGRRERENRHGERGDQVSASKQGGARDETDDEGESEIVDSEGAEVQQCSIPGRDLSRDEREKRSRAGPCQPDDSGLFEPIPAAALVANVCDTGKGH